MNSHNYITADPAVLVGKPVIRGTRLAVEIFGDTVAAIVSREPLYDPRGQKVRGGV